MARRIKQRVKRPEGERPGVDRWRELIREQAESRLTQVEFCEKVGVSVHGFRHWKYRGLGRSKKSVGGRTSGASSGLSVPTPGFVPVEVVFDSAVAPLAPTGVSSAGSGIEVLLPDGLRVGVEAGFDSSVLRQVVEVLGC
jgi:hypothetical protein